MKIMIMAMMVINIRLLNYKLFLLKLSVIFSNIINQHSWQQQRKQRLSKILYVEIHDHPTGLNQLLVLVPSKILFIHYYLFFLVLPLLAKHART